MSFSSIPLARRTARILPAAASSACLAALALGLCFSTPTSITARSGTTLTSEVPITRTNLAGSLSSADNAPARNSKLNNIAMFFMLPPDEAIQMKNGLDGEICSEFWFVRVHSERPQRMAILLIPFCVLQFSLSQRFDPHTLRWHLPNKIPCWRQSSDRSRL